MQLLSVFVFLFSLTGTYFVNKVTISNCDQKTIKSCLVFIYETTAYKGICRQPRLDNASTLTVVMPLIWRAFLKVTFSLTCA